MAHDPTQQLLARALAHAADFLDGTPARSVAPTATAAELHARLHRPLPAAGEDPLRVLDDLVRDTDGGHVGSASGRFFGFVIGGSLPAALAADWMTSVWDNNSGIYACGPASSVVESVAGEWLKDVLGLPAGASFALVTGCQMAHTTCFAAARHALLARRGWDAEVQGLAGTPAIRVLTSVEVHGTVERAVRLIGIGAGQIERLPSGADGRLAPETLAAALEASPSQPTIVVLQAADLNIGAFDDFAALVPLAHAAGAWVHVDGAFGLWAAASPAHRSKLAGCEAADSWATDGHKWLNVPYDCGYAFVADPAPHHGSMALHAAYLTHAGTMARDALNFTPEFSRRGRGFATYAALRELGRDGLAALVDRCCAHAHALVTRIGALQQAELLWEPAFNQGLVRFHLGKGDAAADDRFTDAVIAAINASGEAFFSGTTWRGVRCMRVSVVNWRTNGEDVDRSVAAAARALEVVRARARGAA
jgi:glutamate/tyrosine decarboxylase-like PLP-dependent enzyme